LSSTNQGSRTIQKILQLSVPTWAQAGEEPWGYIHAQILASMYGEERNTRAKNYENLEMIYSKNSVESSAEVL